MSSKCEGTGYFLRGTKANPRVPQIFLANIKRLSTDRFSIYYCNKCATEHAGPPLISYNNPNEELGEGEILESDRIPMDL